MAGDNKYIGKPIAREPIFEFGFTKSPVTSSTPSVAAGDLSVLFKTGDIGQQALARLSGTLVDPISPENIIEQVKKIILNRATSAFEVEVKSKEAKTSLSTEELNLIEQAYGPDEAQQLGGINTSFDWLKFYQDPQKELSKVFYNFDVGNFVSSVFGDPSIANDIEAIFINDLASGRIVPTDSLTAAAVNSFEGRFNRILKRSNLYNSRGVKVASVNDLFPSGSSPLAFKGANYSKVANSLGDSIGKAASAVTREAGVTGYYSTLAEAMSKDMKNFFDSNGIPKPQISSVLTAQEISTIKGFLAHRELAESLNGVKKTLEDLNKAVKEGALSGNSTDALKNFESLFNSGGDLDKAFGSLSALQSTISGHPLEKALKANINASSGFLNSLNALRTDLNSGGTLFDVASNIRNGTLGIINTTPFALRLGGLLKVTSGKNGFGARGVGNDLLHALGEEISNLDQDGLGAVILKLHNAGFVEAEDMVRAQIWNVPLRNNYHNNRSLDVIDSLLDGKWVNAAIKYYLYNDNFIFSPVANPVKAIRRFFGDLGLKLDDKDIEAGYGVGLLIRSTPLGRVFTNSHKIKIKGMPTFSVTGGDGNAAQNLFKLTSLVSANKISLSQLQTLLSANTNPASLSLATKHLLALALGKTAAEFDALSVADQEKLLAGMVKSLDTLKTWLVKSGINVNAANFVNFVDGYNRWFSKYGTIANLGKKYVGFLEQYNYVLNAIQKKFYTAKLIKGAFDKYVKVRMIIVNRLVDLVVGSLAGWTGPLAVAIDYVARYVVNKLLSGVTDGIKKLFSEGVSGAFEIVEKNVQQVLKLILIIVWVPITIFCVIVFFILTILTTITLSPENQFVAPDGFEAGGSPIDGEVGPKTTTSGCLFESINEGYGVPSYNGATTNDYRHGNNKYWDFVIQENPPVCGYPLPSSYVWGSGGNTRPMGPASDSASYCATKAPKAPYYGYAWDVFPGGGSSYSVYAPKAGGVKYWKFRSSAATSAVLDGYNDSGDLIYVMPLLHLSGVEGTTGEVPIGTRVATGLSATTGDPHVHVEIAPVVAGVIKNPIKPEEVVCK